MTDHERYILISEAAASEDKELFCAEWATSSIFGEESDLLDNHAVCAAAWDAAHITIKEIRAATGLSQVKFGERFLIPRRSIENWEADVRDCPIYLKILLAERVGVISIPGKE